APSPLSLHDALPLFHQRDFGIGQLDTKVRRLGKADPMLAADRSFQRNNALEQRALGLGRAPHLILVAGCQHEIDMDVAIADMARSEEHTSELQSREK